MSDWFQPVSGRSAADNNVPPSGPFTDRTVDPDEPTPIYDDVARQVTEVE